jgi:hypothetical protein
MIADSSPVDGFKGSLGVVGVKLASLAGFFRGFAEGLAVDATLASLSNVSRSRPTPSPAHGTARSEQFCSDAA